MHDYNLTKCFQGMVNVCMEQCSVYICKYVVLPSHYNIPLQSSGGHLCDLHCEIGTITSNLIVS